MDGLEAEWQGEVRVLRLNVHHRDARSLLDRLDFRFTPTFLLFDDQGREVWRSVGSIDAGNVRQTVSQLN